MSITYRQHQQNSEFSHNTSINASVSVRPPAFRIGVIRLKTCSWQILHSVQSDVLLLIQSEICMHVVWHKHMSYKNHK